MESPVHGVRKGLMQAHLEAGGYIWQASFKVSAFVGKGSNHPTVKGLKEPFNSADMSDSTDPLWKLCVNNDSSLHQLP